MIFSALFLGCYAGLALAQNFTPAPVVTSNSNASYVATLDNSSSSSIRGSVTAKAGPDGIGLTFEVSFTGLPSGLGPFPYHVHVLPVPANGDCNSTLGHLDPYNRGDLPPCDASDPATCQIGDLSGKHGFASGSEFYAVYNDNYLSNDPSSNAFIGDRSIVIHSANLTRLNCGNFQLANSIV